LHRQEAGFAVARKRGSRTVSPDNSHLLSSYLVRLHLRRLSGVRSKVVAQRWSPLHTVCRTTAEFSHPRTCLVLFEVSGMFGIIWVFAATLFHACGGPASHLPCSAGPFCGNDQGLHGGPCWHRLLHSRRQSMGYSWVSGLVGSSGRGRGSSQSAPQTQPLCFLSCRTGTLWHAATAATVMVAEHFPMNLVQRLRICELSALVQNRVPYPGRIA
jgi:hypothetical protein